MKIEIDKELEGNFLHYAKQSRQDPAQILSKLLHQYLEDLHDRSVALEAQIHMIEFGDELKSFDQLAKEIGFDG